MPERAILLAVLLLTLAIVGCGPGPARSDGTQLPRGTALPPPGLGTADRR